MSFTFSGLSHDPIYTDNNFTIYEYIEKDCRKYSLCCQFTDSELLVERGSVLGFLGKIKRTLNVQPNRNLYSGTGYVIFKLRTGYLTAIKSDSVRVRHSFLASLNGTTIIDTRANKDYMQEITLTDDTFEVALPHVIAYENTLKLEHGNDRGILCGSGKILYTLE